MLMKTLTVMCACAVLAAGASLATAAGGKQPGAGSRSQQTEQTDQRSGAYQHRRQQGNAYRYGQQETEEGVGRAGKGAGGPGRGGKGRQQQ